MPSVNEENIHWSHVTAHHRPSLDYFLSVLVSRRTCVQLAVLLPTRWALCLACKRSGAVHRAATHITFVRTNTATPERSYGWRCRKDPQSERRFRRSVMFRLSLRTHIRTWGDREAFSFVVFYIRVAFVWRKSQGTGKRNTAAVFNKIYGFRLRWCSDFWNFTSSKWILCEFFFRGFFQHLFCSVAVRWVKQRFPVIRSLTTFTGPFVC